MSRPDTKSDVVNYFRRIAHELYSEQDPKIQTRIDNITSRLGKYEKRLDTVKRGGSPMGRETIRRHLLGGATGVAEILEGEAGKRVVQQRRRQQKKKPRKSRVVK